MFLAATPVVLPFDLGSLVREAMQSSQTEQRIVAAAMGISPQCLDQQLNGIGHLSLNRVLMAGTKRETRAFGARLLVLLVKELRAEREIGIDLIREEVLSALANLPRRSVTVDVRERAEKVSA